MKAEKLFQKQILEKLDKIIEAVEPAKFSDEDWGDDHAVAYRIVNLETGSFGKDPKILPVFAKIFLPVAQVTLCVLVVVFLLSLVRVL